MSETDKTIETKKNIMRNLGAAEAASQAYRQAMGPLFKKSPLEAKAVADALYAYEDNRKASAKERESLDAEERKAFELVLEAATVHSSLIGVVPVAASKVKSAIKLVREVLADAFPEPEKPAAKKTPGEVLYTSINNGVILTKKGPEWAGLPRWEQDNYERSAAEVRAHAKAEEQDAKQPSEQQPHEPEYIAKARAADSVDTLAGLASKISKICPCASCAARRESLS